MVELLNFSFLEKVMEHSCN